MKFIAKLSAAGLALCLGASAHAELVTYNFSATVSSIWSSCSYCDSGLYYMDEIHEVDGTVKVGDRITGTYRYDNAAPFRSDSTYPGSQDTTYFNTLAESLDYVFAPSGLPFRTYADDTWNTGKQVEKWSSRGDSFTQNFYGYQGVGEPLDSSRTAVLRFLDPSSTALPTTALPATLDPSRFSSLILTSYFNVYESSLGVDAVIDRFEPVAPVPEPGSLALLGLGAAGLGFMRRRTRRAKAA